MLVVFVVVGGILVGCGGEADIQKVDAEPNGPKTEETQGEVKVEEPKGEILTIGDTVKFNEKAFKEVGLYFLHWGNQ